MTKYIVAIAIIISSLLVLPWLTRRNAAYLNSSQQRESIHASGLCADLPVGRSGISYQPISTDVDLDKQQITFSLSLQFFAADVAEKDYSALIFFDGRQVYQGDDVMRLRCGEEATQQFVVDISASGMPSTAHFFIVEIPDDASSSHFPTLPDAAASDIIRFADAIPYQAEAFRDIPVTIIPHIPHIPHDDDATILMYLFETEPEKQLEPFLHLSKDVQDYAFSLRFQKEKHRADTITLTCTLNNKQQAMFKGHYFWSGKLNDGDEIHLQGKVRVDEAGWHALRCFALDGLYDDTVEFSSSFLPVVYIHKAE